MDIFSFKDRDKKTRAFFLETYLLITFSSLTKQDLKRSDVLRDSKNFQEYIPRIPLLCLDYFESHHYSLCWLFYLFPIFIFYWQTGRCEVRMRKFCSGGFTWNQILLTCWMETGLPLDKAWGIKRDRHSLETEIHMRDWTTTITRGITWIPSPFGLLGWTCPILLTRKKRRTSLWLNMSSSDRKRAKCPVKEDPFRHSF